MQLENKLPKKVIQILDSLPDSLPSNQKDCVEKSIQVLLNNPNFVKALNAVHNIAECQYIFQDENNGILHFPIRLSQKEGRFDAEMEISMQYVGTELEECNVDIMCTDEIFYNLPLNTVQEVDKFRRLKPEAYKAPKGSKFIYTAYLDRVFFAFLKNYYFMASYSPSNKNPVTITEIMSYDSAKAAKSYPEYLPDSAEASRLKVKQHIGGTQTRKVEWNFDSLGRILDKTISMDTYFRVLREYREYKITPQIRGCIIERTEEGKMSGNTHRSSSRRKVTKKVNIPFDRLTSLGMIATEFEKRCVRSEKSKLVAPEVPEYYLNEKLRLRREDKALLGKKRSPESSKEQIEQGRRPADPGSIKIKLNYLQNQKLKELKHDESIRYQRSMGHSIDLLEEVLNTYPELQEDNVVTTTTIQPEKLYAVTMTTK